MSNHSSSKQPARSRVMFHLTVIALPLVMSACFSLTGRRPEAVADQVDETSAQAIAPSTQRQSPAPTGRQLVADLLLADGSAQRVELLRQLCRNQPLKAPEGPTSAMRAAGWQWLSEYRDPQDERSRRQTVLGPRVGVADVLHQPGYELWVETAGGVLVFSRDGELLGRVGQGEERLSGLALHDVDGDGQEELFFKIDSDGNSGNRFTRLYGYKERGGELSLVLERKLYETAWRWVPAGLGSRLSVVTLAGRPYVVIDPEGEAEYLRWDEAQGTFVRENAPPRRAFLDTH